MPSWEHRTETVDVWSDNSGNGDPAGLSADLLNAIAGEGWELVSAFPIAGHGGPGQGPVGTYWVHYIFRRPMAT